MSFKHCTLTLNVKAADLTDISGGVYVNTVSSDCGGYTVTVVDGLPHNAGFLKELCQELKRACGTGGAVADGAVELQGDLRERLRECLAAKGFLVKG